MEVYISYLTDNEKFHENFNINDNKHALPHIIIDNKITKYDNYEIISISLIPQKTITIKNFNISINLNLEDAYKIFANGYQSWTECKEYDLHDKITFSNKYLSFLLKKHKLEYYGDYLFYKYKEKEGIIHGYSYSYIRFNNNKLKFFGSLNENSGFTIFEFNTNKNLLNIIKDVQDLEISSIYNILNLIIIDDNENYCFSKYFDELNKLLNFKVNNKNLVGWTSWYNYYHKINEQIILENLDNFYSNNIPIDIFQIDDGYQKAVGDWLVTNKKFPNGMKYICDEIKKRNYKAGIWLAPFVCDKNSTIYNQHKDWILKDSQGNLIPAGNNDNWGGTFYALDVYNEDFREYLKQVFSTIFNEWGFDLVKLDFLYAACIVPRNTKSRGQIMRESLQFLRELCKDKIILGCGTPMWPAFGVVDYCRTSCDIDLQWDNKLYKKLANRERPSTYNSIITNIFRRQLNEKVFINDPDVFILRKENNKLSYKQKKLLFTVQNIFGSVLFTSDNIKNYDEYIFYLYKSMFPVKNKIINNLEHYDDIFKINFTIDNKEYLAILNLGDKTYFFKLENGLYFYNNYENNHQEIISENDEIFISPYDALCLYKINKKVPQLIGSTGHLFPSCEIDDIVINKKEINIKFSPLKLNKSRIFIEVPKVNDTYIINGKEITSVLQLGKPMLMIEL